MDRFFNHPEKSLSDILGKNYTHAVSGAASFFSDKTAEQLSEIADDKVDFYPLEMQERLDSLFPYVGTQVCEPFDNSSNGAGSTSFVKAADKRMSPLAAYGFYRVGEGGKLYFTSKSEHYHASLGHLFPGYRLIENAKKLGIDNATHNNTRGHITRLLEERLVALVNGIQLNDEESISEIINSDDDGILNRVINLGTGSLAVEAAVKMMLTRFYPFESNTAQAVYQDKVPVFIVLADYEGGKQANYHGTTIFTQMMRGRWPELSEKMHSADILNICAVQINDIDDFKNRIQLFDTGKYKVAGFLHELILMNYGGIKLDRDYIREAHDICRSHDIPTLVDEIQSCIWSPELFTFLEYGLSPDFVSVGKGFPGGQFPASRIITTGKMDNLNQFGALVTNGQEELSSLAYLITIDFAYANRAYTQELGDYYSERLIDLASSYPEYIEKVEGMRHLSSMFFHSVEETEKFVRNLNGRGIDISAQTYKPNCPPAALTKLPLTCSKTAVDYLIEKMKIALDEL